MRILMVCLGNICRSPMAEGILMKKAEVAGLNWVVESASTNKYHTGKPPHPLSQKIAKLNGIDVSNQWARRFFSSDIDKYDLIYALAKDVRYEMKIIAGEKFDETKIILLMNELFPEENMDVPDPWYGTEEGYHIVFNMLEEVCEKIITKYKAGHY